MDTITSLIIDLPAYDVAPLDSIGPVKLGMSRSQARSAMSLPYESFLKTPYDASLTDGFHKCGFQIFYDQSDRVEYIELGRGSVKALYKGVSVFETEAEEMIAVLVQDASYDENDPEFGSSYIFPELEMSLWRPVAPEEGQDEDDPDGRYFHTIGIGVKGYYSKDGA